MDLDRTLRDVYSVVRRDDAARIGLEADALFDLLSDGRRRAVIERLADRGATQWSELAAEIATRETHMRREQVPRRRVEQVEDDLRTEQLPKLAESGIVRWDGGDDAVRPGHSIEAIARLLREVDRRTVSGGRAGAPFGVGRSPIGRGTQRDPPNRGRYHP